MSESGKDQLNFSLPQQPKINYRRATAGIKIQSYQPADAQDLQSQRSLTPKYAQRTHQSIRRIPRDTDGKFKVENIVPGVALGPGVLGSPTIRDHFRDSTASHIGPTAAASERAPQHARRGSLKDFLRRSSRELRRGVEIVKMNEEERRKYFAAKKMAMERELTGLGEEQQQQQQGGASLESTARADGEVYSLGALLKRANAGRGEDAAIIDPRASVQDGGPMAEASIRQPRIAQGERAAALVSRALDAMKNQRRNDTNDSSMDFADGAPMATMEPCARCKKPTSRFLVHGWCRECLDDYRKADGRF